jgi:hypothetical protein
LHRVLGVAFDPRGGFVVAGWAASGVLEVLHVGGDGAATTIAQLGAGKSATSPRVSADGAQVVFTTREFMPMLFELRDVR